MGQKTDKIIGRAKQALAAVTGNETVKREGQRQEDKGKLKGKLDSTIGKTQNALGGGCPDRRGTSAAILTG
jgi:uncharacterized protein YjbJ (UPF0337 family)